MTIVHRLALFVALSAAIVLAVAGVVTYVLVERSLVARADRELHESGAEFKRFTTDMIEQQKLEKKYWPTGGPQIAPPPKELVSQLRERERPKELQREFRRDLTKPLVVPFTLERPLIGPPWTHAGPDHMTLFSAAPDMQVVPVTTADRDGVRGTRTPQVRKVTIDGRTFRAIALPVDGKGGVLVSRNISDITAVLHDLRGILWTAWIMGSIAALVLGLLAARLGLRPITQLVAAAREVTETRDLQRRLPEGRRDEVGTLSMVLNSLLAALEGSVLAQRQLVADASHELRTPLTSMRTNVELLERVPTMPVHDRAEVLGDVRSQVDELTTLMTDLIGLARGSESAHDIVVFPLHELVDEAVSRCVRHAPDLSYRVDLEASLVAGCRPRLAHAINNLLDNAAKWSPPDGRIEVVLRDGVLTVRDHGPGIEAADLPHVFERFYRSAGARGTRGSGLGLAIVRQVAEAHGGVVRASHAPGGGTLMKLRLPVMQDGSEGGLGAELFQDALAVSAVG